MATSTIDITVSRCMKAWLWGSSMATTVVAWPLSKRALATDSTAIGVVRSPIPMSTAPCPITWTSPPSMVAG